MFHSRNLYLQIILCFTICLKNGPVACLTIPSDTLESYEELAFHNLPFLESSTVRVNKTIFFLATQYYNTYLTFTAHQACAIESAALTNPDYDIILVLPWEQGNSTKTTGPLTNELLGYKNVMLRRSNVSNLFYDTPLEYWYELGLLQISAFQMDYVRDILCYTLLWKYGGAYADLDLLFLSSLGGIMDFVSLDERSYESGIISISHKHPVADLCMYDVIELCKMGNKTDKRYSGLNRAVESYSSSLMIGKKRWKVLPSCTFTPSQWMRSFKFIDESYVMHVSKKDFELNPNSARIYGWFASVLCPRVHSTVNGDFRLNKF